MKLTVWSSLKISASCSCCYMMMRNPQNAWCMCVSSRISNPHCIGRPTVLLAYKKRIIISKFFSWSNKTKGVLIADHLIRSGWDRNSVPVFLRRASLCGKKCSSDWWIRRNRSAPSTSTKGERQLSYRSSSAPRRSSKTLFARAFTMASDESKQRRPTVS